MRPDRWVRLVKVFWRKNSTPTTTPTLALLLNLPSVSGLRGLQRQAFHLRSREKRRRGLVCKRSQVHHQRRGRVGGAGVYLRGPRAGERANSDGISIKRSTP